MVKVFFECGTYAELVATLTSEEVYMLCVPTLEAEAERLGMILTETIEE